MVTPNPTPGQPSDQSSNQSLGAAPPSRPTTEYRAFLVAACAVVGSIAWAVFRSVVSGWTPIGDSAYFTSRSLDVGTSNTPLLGAWSSGSMEFAQPVNSLGPMELYLLAPFTHLSPSAGTAIGIGLVQISATAVVAWLLFRMSGPRSALAGMVGVGWLTWAMGSENLIAAVQHPYLILPFAASMVAAVGVLRGDRVALWALVFFGSLCAQTHLSYPILIATIGGVGAIGWLLHLRHDRGTEASTRRDDYRSTVGALVLALILWTPPLIDQFFGRGNLGHALTQRGGDEAPTGVGVGARLVATVVTDPATLGPRGYHHPNPIEGLAGPARGWIVVAAMVALVVWSVWAWRQRRPVMAPWATVLGIALGAMIVDAGLIPATSFGFRLDNYRWTWAWLGLLIAAGMIFGDRLLARAPSIGGRWRSQGHYALVALVVALAVWNLVPRGAGDMTAYEPATDDLVAIQDQLDAYLSEHALEGPVVIDDAGIYLGSPHNYPVVVVAQEHDLDFRFVFLQYGYRYGDNRLADGSERYVLKIWLGEDAAERRDAMVAYADRFEPAGIELIEIAP